MCGVQVGGNSVLQHQCLVCVCVCVGVGGLVSGCVGGCVGGVHVHGYGWVVGV